MLIWISVTYCQGLSLLKDWGIYDAINNGMSTISSCCSGVVFCPSSVIVTFPFYFMVTRRWDATFYIDPTFSGISFSFPLTVTASTSTLFLSLVGFCLNVYIFLTLFFLNSTNLVAFSFTLLTSQLC